MSPMSSFHFPLLILAHVFMLLSEAKPMTYIYVAVPKNYTDAKQYCTENVGRLATVPDATANKLIFDKVASKAQAGYFPNVWLGGHQVSRGSENTGVAANWKWTDGNAFTYTNWHYGEPNNGGTLALEEDCLEYQSLTGEWNDASCIQYAQYVCASSDLAIEFVFENSWNNFWSADQDCKTKYGVGLLSIGSAVVNANLQAYLKKVAPQVDRVWIGGWQNLSAEAATTDRYWEWLDGTNFTWLNWAPTEPNDWGVGEDCIEFRIYRHGEWNDLACSSKLPFLCGSNATNRTVEVKLVRETYFAAEAICQREFGTHLISIPNKAFSDQVVAALIAQLPLNAPGGWWIGGLQRDNGTEVNPNAYGAGWVWESTQPVTYTNWYPNEPNDASAGAGEDCIEMYTWADGMWNDKSCSAKNYFVCEVVQIGGGGGRQPTPQPTVYGQVLFEYVANIDSLNVRDANTYCKTLYNGGLVSITSGYVNFLVTQFLYNKHLYGLVIIGAIAPPTTGKLQYSWVDNSTFKYSAFGVSNLNLPESGRIETCLAIDSSKRGLWYPVSCATQLPFICWKNKPSTLATMRPTAPAPTTQFSTKFKFVHNLAVTTVDDAEKYCVRHHKTSLLSIHDDTTNTQLLNYLFEHGITSQVMIGGKQIGKEFKVTDNWFWQDGTRLFNHSFWAAREPDNEYLTSDCLVVDSFSIELSDVSCARVDVPFVCWASVNKQPQPFKPRPVIDATYFAYHANTNKQDLQHLDASCRFLYGTRAISLVSDHERLVLRQFLNANNAPRQVAIGGKRNVSMSGSAKMNWAWTDGTVFNFHNWNSGEPNQRGREDCIEFLVGQQGKWNDIKCNDYNLGFVCAGPAAPRGWIRQPTSAPTTTAQRKSTTSGAAQGGGSKKSKQSKGATALIVVLILVIVCVMAAGGYLYWRSKKVKHAVLGDEEESIEEDLEKTTGGLAAK